MKITVELIDKLSSLSSLDFERLEKKAIRFDLQRMPDCVGRLTLADTDRVKLLLSLTTETNPFSKDVSFTEISKKEAFKNSPYADLDYFRVPRLFNKTS